MDFDDFVLAASTADLSEEAAARQYADAVEFRMDLASTPLADLDAYTGELPIIATNRARWEGGEAEPDARIDAIVSATEHDAVTAIDVELATLRGRTPNQSGISVDTLVGQAREHGVKVIASVHDFHRTPSPGPLDTLLKAATRAGDIGKLAVTAQSTMDALRVLAATHRATERGDRVATMAMGPVGRHTRAVAPVYGSRIGYAPVRTDDSTAPGQYDLATLADLVARLR